MTEKLIEIFQKETGIKDLTIDKDTVLRNDLKINSYDFVQVICAIEDEFDIEIPDRDLAKMITVGDVTEYIEAHI
ncbi:MAG: acyl carrier protein [Clostridia bacterium]|nr:acyl carrier protein [Clostridia bacterium]